MATALAAELERSASIEERDFLVESCRFLIERFARRNAGRGLDVDDLRQVGYLALLKAAPAWDPGRGVKFVTWAYPIVANAITDAVREHARRRPVFQGAADIYRVGVFDAGPGPEPSAEAADDAEQIHRAMGELPAQSRRGIDLVFGLGCEAVPRWEAARMLGLSLRAFKSMERNALETLRRVVARDC